MSVNVLCRAGIYPHVQIPYLLESVQAGFPSPAQDYIEQQLDLNELCIRHPAATYFVRAAGDSMIEAGIFDGDILVVDRSLSANHGDTIIAAWNGELTVKELQLQPVKALLPRNPQYPAIQIPAFSELEVFGVVTRVIHSLRS